MLRSRAVCWLLKQARAVVDEDEEAASSNRPIYEARHTPSAAAAARTVRGDCSQPGSDSAAQRRSRAIRLAVRLVRESAPKGARMFTSNDVTSKCEAQSSQLAPSLVDRHLQRASRGAPTSRTSSSTINGGTQSQTGELHVAFRNDVACVEQRNGAAQTVEKPHPSARKRYIGPKIRLVGSMGRVHVVKAN